MIRDDLMLYLTGADLGSFSMSVELPFSNSGLPLYQKNPKKIYVDADQNLVEPIVVTFADTTNQTTTVVTVYFSNDAKTQPTDYNAMCDIIETFIVTYKLDGLMNATSDLTSEYINDLMITKINLTFVKIN